MVEIHGPMKTTGETRCLEVISISCLHVAAPARMHKELVIIIMPYCMYMYPYRDVSLKNDIGFIYFTLLFYRITKSMPSTKVSTMGPLSACKVLCTVMLNFHKNCFKYNVYKPIQLADSFI